MLAATLSSRVSGKSELTWENAVKRIWIAATLAVAMVAAGCAGFGSSKSGGATDPNQPAPQSNGVTVTPATATLQGGATQTFTAKASDSATATFTWSVNGTAGTRPWLPASFAGVGGTLRYTLSRMPDKNWGAAAADMPPSFGP